MNLLTVLTDAGLTVHETDGWRDRKAPGTFTPVGVMNHHTAARSHHKPHPSLHIVQHGRSDLPGPLCNLLIGRDASIWLISGGRANDSGRGNSSVLNRVRKDQPPTGDATASGDINGNRWFYDIEVENDGVGEPYPDAQIGVLVAVNAAICRAKGWPADRCLHHREWTSRKIDMSWRGPLRARIADALATQPHPPPDQEEAMTVPTGWIGRGSDRDPVALCFSDGHKIEAPNKTAGAAALGEAFGVPFDLDRTAAAPNQAYDAIPPVT